jgi:hypothetical protein
LRRLFIVLLGLMIGSRIVAAQTAFDLAEQRLAACAAHADIHPPVRFNENSVAEACHDEIEAYVRACMTRSRYDEPYEPDCRYAALTLADTLQKHDPIDVQFVDCLKKNVQTQWLPLVLLALCRSERHAYEASCRKRKDASQCERDSEEMALIATCNLAPPQHRPDYICKTGGGK